MAVYWKAGAALVAYLVLAWVMGSILKLDGKLFYIMFAVLAVLGISATAIFLWWWGKRKGAASQGSGPVDRDEEIDALWLYVTAGERG